MILKKPSQKETRKKPIAGQKLFLTTFIAALTFLGFILGTVVMSFELNPFYSPLDNAYDAARAWFAKLNPPSREDLRFKLFDQAQKTQTGVLQYDPKQAYNGYTLLTSGHGQKAFLISMKGEIVHEWDLPFSQVWSSPPHIKTPAADEFGYWRQLYLYPNGDLIAVYENENSTPNGYGLVKINKDSQVIWKYSERVHHDVYVASDGKIYTLIHKIIKDKIPGVKETSDPWLNDYIVVLSQDGKELKRVDIAKAFANSDYSGVMTLTKFNWDLFHTNAVEVLEPEMAAKFPLFKSGQVLISTRQQSAIAVVDLESEQVIWAATGSWSAQHDPDFLKNGNILLFDNRGNIGKGGGSRILELDPKTLNTVWQYTGNEKEIFSSQIRAMQQRLPNGNTLITESHGGRIFEVTSSGKIVWEYSSPFRSAHNQQIVAVISSAQRFASDALPFAFSSLKQK